MRNNEIYECCECHRGISGSWSYKIHLMASHNFISVDAAKQRDKQRGEMRAGIVVKNPCDWRTVRKGRYRTSISEKQRYRRAFYLKANHNVSEIQYEAKLKKQNFRCAICGKKHEERRGGRLHVDHDHKTKKNRDLLCGPCNTRLHIFEDENSGLKSAMEKYIRRHKKNSNEQTWK